MFWGWVMKHIQEKTKGGVLIINEAYKKNCGGLSERIGRRNAYR